MQDSVAEDFVGEEGLAAPTAAPILKAELRAQEYRARAKASSAAAAGYTLAHQRALHDNAAATWTRMAEVEERRILDAHKAIAAASAATAAKAARQASMSVAS